ADGANLRITVPVAFDEAVLGTTVSVPLLDGGTVSVKIPPGTPSGRTLRVRGKGLVTKKSTGDLHVTVQVVIPTHVEGEARRAAEDLRAARAGEDPRAGLAEAAARSGPAPGPGRRGPPLRPDRHRRIPRGALRCPARTAGTTGRPCS